MAETSKAKTKQYYQDAAKALDPEYLMKAHGEALQGNPDSSLQRAKILTDEHAETTKNYSDRSLLNEEDGPKKAGLIDSSVSVSVEETSESRRKKEQKKNKRVLELLYLLEAQLRELEDIRDYWQKEADTYKQEADEYRQKAEELKRQIDALDEVTILMESGQWKKLGEEEKNLKMRMVGLGKDANIHDIQDRKNELVTLHDENVQKAECKYQEAEEAQCRADKADAHGASLTRTEKIG